MCLVDQTTYLRDYLGRPFKDVFCETCGGSGYEFSFRCMDCRGLGVMYLLTESEIYMGEITWHNQEAMTVSAAMQALRLEVVRGRIAFSRDPAIEKIGSIIIPDEAQQKLLSGTVVAVSEEVTEVQVGDRIYFTKYGGTTYEIPLPGGGTHEVELCLQDDLFMKSRGPE